MKILITGGRGYADYGHVYRYLSAFPSTTVVIHGGARGADTLADRAARALGMTVISCPAEWGRYGKRAGYLRNVAMADMRPDVVVAFPGGVGTQKMCEVASKRGIPVVKP